MSFTSTVLDGEHRNWTVAKAWDEAILIPYLVLTFIEMMELGLLHYAEVQDICR